MSRTPETQTSMQCRVCGSNRQVRLGKVEYYAGYPCEFLDCQECLCRYTSHVSSLHDTLHANTTSAYGIYNELANKTKQFFLAQDPTELRDHLCTISKYRFVIEHIEHHARETRLLEIGCSRGHLTSYFIRNGYSILGSDISAAAVEGARELFGNYFVETNSSEIQARAPYDVIYHVGTIGCVVNPIQFTHDLLGMLRPGGKLIFNAPNLDFCTLEGQLWCNAPPPDLVTMFRPGFWRKYFSGVADVTEEVETCPAEECFRNALRKKFARTWQSPVPLCIDTSIEDYRTGRLDNNIVMTPIWSIFERIIMKAARVTGLIRFAPSLASPYGLFITMRKR